MARVLVIDTAARDKIAKIVAHAQQREHWYNPFDKSDGWISRLPGNNKKLCCNLFDGYRCVFSYTLDTRKNAVYRHLSMSVASEGYPAPAAAREIAGLFGFTGSQDDELRTFPDDWSIQINHDGPIDDHCIVIAQLVADLAA